MKKFICLSFFFAALIGLLSAQDVEVFPRSKGGVRDVMSISPDGKWLIGNSSTKSVTLWDAETGREFRTIDTGTDIKAVAFSPDSKRFLYASGNFIIVCITETGALHKIFIGHTEIVNSARFSPDGKRIVSGSNDRAIKIWDAETGEAIKTITGFARGISGVLWHGRMIAVIDGKVVKLLDAETGRELRSLTGHGDYINMAFSPDGRRIITGSQDNTLKIWDAETGKKIMTYEAKSMITAVGYSPNGRNIACVAAGLSIRILDAGTARALRSIRVIENPSALDFRITITNIVYSPNSRKIIGAGGGLLKAWDAENSRELLSITPPVTRVALTKYSPNGRRIAAAYSNNTVKVWDTGSGRLVSAFLADTNKYHYFHGIAWSPDSSKLTAVFAKGVGDREQNTIGVWNVETGQKVRTLTSTEFAPGSQEERRNDFRSVAWSPDGKKIIAASVEKMIKAWDAESGRELKPFANLSDLGYALDYSPDGKVVACTVDNTVILYDAASGREIRQLSGYGDYSESVAISADGKKIASGSRNIGDGNNKIKIWDLETGRELLAIDTGENIDVDSVSFNAGGKQIIAGLHYYSSDYHYIELYDAENGNDLGRLVGSPANSANPASASADGKWIVTGSEDGAVRVWNAETRAEKARFIAYDDGEWLAMTPDGYYNTSANGGKYVNVRVGNTVTGIDRYRSAFNKPAVVTARLSNPARMTHNDAVNSVAVNPGGTRIASVSHDKSIKLWDLESGRILRTITNIGGYANAVSFSPDGRRLIHGAEDKTVRIWDAETGAAVRTITGHTDYVNEARYSPDGKRIASCADDKLIKVWDASDQGSATGREIRTLTGHTDLVTVVAWSPDGRRIASGSDATEKAIRIWDTESGRVLQTITGQGGRIFALAYSPDGKKIASSALEDKAVKIWDAETGRPIRSIPVEDNGGVYSLAWSPDGKRLATGAIYGGEDDYGNHIELWNAETGELIRTIWESGSILSLAFTPDGRRIVATSNFSDAWFIKVYDALTGEEL